MCFGISGVISANKNTFKLTSILILVSGFSTVYLQAQVSDVIDTVDKATTTFASFGVLKIYAFTTIAAIALAAWTQWILYKTISKMAQELHERPCIYTKKGVE